MKEVFSIKIRGNSGEINATIKRSSKAKVKTYAEILATIHGIKKPVIIIRKL